MENTRVTKKGWAGGEGGSSPGNQWCLLEWEDSGGLSLGYRSWRRGLQVKEEGFAGDNW